MNIVIIGNGKVGYTLGNVLADEGHDVTVVDNDNKALERASETLDVLCIRGNGANARTLIEAGVQDADIVISVTASDETNMLCCLLAKQLGAKYAIARIRDPEFTESINLLQKEMSIDMVINPERGAAYEISRLFRYPYAANVETFAHGRVEMVQFRVEDEGIIDKPLTELRQKFENVLVCVVERGGEAYIPGGNFILRKGDTIHVASDISNMSLFFKKLGRNTERVRSAILIGGGHISYYLAKIINNMGVDLRIIEIDREKSRRLADQLPDVCVINDDGTDQDVLLGENIADCDALVCLTNRDEENMITGLFGVRQGVDKVIVKVNRLNYLELFEDMGLESVISPKEMTTSAILRQVRARSQQRNSVIEKIYRIVGGRVEALEFTAREDGHYLHIPLKRMRIAPGVLVAMIVRDKHVIIPFGNDTIEPGDTVLLVSKANKVADLEDVLQQ